MLKPSEYSIWAFAEVVDCALGNDGPAFIDVDVAMLKCICLCEKVSVYIEKTQKNKTIGTCTSLYQGSYQMWWRRGESPLARDALGQPRL